MVHEYLMKCQFRNTSRGVGEDGLRRFVWIVFEPDPLDCLGRVGHRQPVRSRPAGRLVEDALLVAAPGAGD